MPFSEFSSLFFIFHYISLSQSSFSLDRLVTLKKANKSIKKKKNRRRRIKRERTLQTWLSLQEGFSLYHYLVPLLFTISFKNKPQETGWLEIEREMVEYRSLCSLLFLALLVSCTSGESPYRFYDWNVTYGDIYPLGVKQKVTYFIYIYIYI